MAYGRGHEKGTRKQRPRSQQQLERDRQQAAILAEKAAALAKQYMQQWVVK